LGTEQLDYLQIMGMHVELSLVWLKEEGMQRNSSRQGAMTWLWIGFAVVIALVALYVLLGLFG
jgi:hypothetical protein